ncbi:MAG TPA: hypothetical protein VLB83_03790 [Candidatus Paceibacterota bacterium]|nr:hypothetical protein [Candidatus Paceibacterota bacterium]
MKSLLAYFAVTLVAISVNLFDPPLFFVDRQFIANLIVFYSILFGFCITGLSILATSRFVARLYKSDDPEHPGKTMLDTLVGRFRSCLFYALGALAYFYSVDLVISNTDKERLLSSDLLALPLTPFMLMGFYASYVILTTLAGVVLQEGKQNFD